MTSKLSPGRGDLIVVPDARHTLEALEDISVLLTVAKQQVP
jgi:hypothetical protein